MGSSPHIVVIGSDELADTVRRALPTREVITAAQPLDAIWSAPQHPQADFLLSISSHPKAQQAIAGLRRVAGARLVVSCQATDEPLARASLRLGVDDYLLEPLVEDELQAALPEGADEAEDTVPPEIKSSAPLLDESQVEQALNEPIVQPSLESSSPPASEEISPTSFLSTVDEGPLIEITGFAEVLKNLDRGPSVVLELLARLIQSTLEADAVAIDYGEHYVRVGRLIPPVTEIHLDPSNPDFGRLRVTPSTEQSLSESDLHPMANLLTTTLQAAETRKNLGEMAWRDDLSGLYNRRYFAQSLDRLIVTAAQQRSQLTVMLFDIDNFKRYNDDFGHDTGDALIRELAELLRRSSRADDVVARYGGDEFSVIFWDAEAPRVAGSKHPTEVVALAKRFQATIRSHAFDCLGPNAPGPVTISGGLSCYPWHGTTRETLIRSADQALLSAKRSGKNKMALAGESFPTVR